MHELLKKIFRREDLSREEASYGMDLIMLGQATPAQIAALVVALKLKGESVSEVAGFV